MARILVTDDSSDVRSALRALLAESGHEVVDATDPECVLELALSLEPDLVVLDVAIPGASSLEGLRRLKADPRTRRIPVIMATEWRERDLVRAAIDAGARDYITKPWRAAEVSSCVSSALAASARPVDDDEPDRSGAAIARQRSRSLIG